MTQTAVRSDTGANKLTMIADFGIHHASKLVRLLLSQSPEMSVVGLLMVELRTTRRGVWTHFLMKTLPKVASEMALCVLAYNLTRVMNIVGTEALLAAIKV